MTVDRTRALGSQSQSKTETLVLQQKEQMLKANIEQLSKGIDDTSTCSLPCSLDWDATRIVFYVCGENITENNCLFHWKIGRCFLSSYMCELDSVLESC